MKKANSAVKVEVLQQVRLSPNQKITLIAAANNGGVCKNLTYNERETLKFLGLVEQRPIASAVLGLKLLFASLARGALSARRSKTRIGGWRIGT